MDYKQELATIKAALNIHITTVTKLQKQIDREEKAIFSSLKKEKNILQQLNNIAHRRIKHKSCSA